ncbi:ATP-binding protein [Sphingomonas sp.]|uniref:ATP-binding protein n=1 Tax=Sphingomonas sp. TaxID=28214 RepID=UPI002DD64069|nr:ATP-binding protein [Sphingomonas sp.]
MTYAVDMGLDSAGRTIAVDLEELLATRLLVQGNSGSGKSHLLRRLLEGSANQVQQVVIDPEGDFVTLADAYGHIAIEAVDYSAAELIRFAGRAREHRTSVVLSLEGLEMEGQMRSATAFLTGLFDAPREHWYPALVVVDEAQIFAPSGGAEVGEEVRRTCLGAMANLMSRGRKRGLAGVIATQRLAKLSKNVAAEASNFLMGRTFLDIDMARAADLLGMERRQAESIRDLARGTFLGLGPAIARRPVTVRIGAVETSARSSSPKLVPLPTAPAEDARDLLFAGLDLPPPPPPPAPAPPPAASEVLRDLGPQPSPHGFDFPEPDAPDPETVVVAALHAIVDDPETATKPAAVLYQDFGVRCRMAGIRKPPIDVSAFARRLAAARAGIFGELTGEWAEAMAAAHGLPDDMLGAFLLIARSAREGLATPDDAAIARTYGTSSLGRARRMLGYMESRDIIVTRTDLSGRRSVTIPRLGWSTAPAEG